MEIGISKKPNVIKKMDADDRHEQPVIISALQLVCIHFANIT